MLLLRTYYMLGLSCLLLLAAGAVALGAFGFTSATRPQHTLAPPVTQPAAAYTARPAAPLELTYYLVDSEAFQHSLNSLKNQLVQAEWLEHASFEVLVVQSTEEEAAARLEIEAAQARSPTSRVLVEDLRAR